jgi:hypothetical protein
MTQRDGRNDPVPGQIQDIALHLTPDELKALSQILKWGEVSAHFDADLGDQLRAKVNKTLDMIGEGK